MPSLTQLILVPFSAFAVYWLAPIIATLPAPDLPSRQLYLSNGHMLDAAFGCRRIGTVAPNVVASDLTPEGLVGPSEKLDFCEDAGVWTEAGIVIISCDPGRGDWNTVMGPLNESNPRGKLYAYHYADLPTMQDPPSSSQLYPLEIVDFPPESDFHPLAVDFHPASPLTATVFVVNHRGDRGVVEVLEAAMEAIPLSGSADYVPAKKEVLKLVLRWKHTLSHPKIWTPNAVAPLSHTSFLLTNDHFGTRRNPVLRLVHVLETYLALPLASVVRVDFDDGSGEVLAVETVIRGLAFANGISVSPDQSTVAVAETMARRVGLYALSSSSRLEYEGSVGLDFGPDNIKWTAEPGARGTFKGGVLTVAGHAHPISTVKLAANPHGPRDGLSPGSAVVRIVEESSPSSSTTADGKRAPRYVLRDDGRWFATSATGVDVGRGRVIVTGLYEHGVLDCRTTSSSDSP